MYGVWLLPAVLGPLWVRKPGAAVYSELVAATVSAFLGTGVLTPFASGRDQVEI